MIDTFEPGAVIAGKYRVEHKLGEGGMGVVVAAQHLQLPQRVAIKFLKRSASDSALERFVREARSVAQLESEHVTRVLDVGSLPSGEPYIVMELLEGRDLRAESAARGRIPVAEAVDYILQACVGLAEAHSLGMVHRDLKPANLFLTESRDGRHVVKVLDFGVSKVNAVAKGPLTALTETGAWLGSPRFMSPEQLHSSRDVDARADIWSLGVTLYSLVAGRPPFAGEVISDLMISILEARPAPVSQVLPGAPRELEQALSRCLMREPDARFANLGELALALAPLAPPSSRALVERIVAIFERSSGRYVAPPAGASASAPTPLMPTADTEPAQLPQPTVPGSPLVATTVSDHTVPMASRGSLGIGVKVALGMAALTVIVGVGVAAAMVASGGRDAHPRSAKSASPAASATTTSSASSQGPAVDVAAPYYQHAPQIAELVRRAHGGKVRVYDALFFEKRARLVIESRAGGSLVRYDFEDGAMTGPSRYEIASPTQLDSLLLDATGIDWTLLANLASRAPKRMQKPPSELHSISMHRLGEGLMWAVSFSDGAACRYSLSGKELR